MKCESLKNVLKTTFVASYSQCLELAKLMYQNMSDVIQSIAAKLSFRNGMSLAPIQEMPTLLYSWNSVIQVLKEVGLQEVASQLRDALYWRDVA